MVASLFCDARRNRKYIKTAKKSCHPEPAGTMLELARRGAELDAVVCLHGDLATTMPAKQGDTKAAIFVIRGSKDPVAPKADRDALEAELDVAEANWQLLDFGGRPDSFSDEETDMPGFAKFDAGAAHQTYRTLDDFIRTRLPRGCSRPSWAVLGHLTLTRGHRQV